MKKKQCKKCKKRRSVSCFSAHKTTKDRLQTECKSCDLRRTKEWRANNRERHNDHLRVSKLRRQGVEFDLLDLDELRKAQQDLCAICGKPETMMRQNSQSVLSVDHCHTSLKVRGLLCRRCNTGIGNFDEDLDRLRAAIAYLERHK